MSICAACGQTVLEGLKGSWDFDTLKYTWKDGEVVMARPTPAKMFEMLWNRFGRTVTYDALMTGLYLLEPDPPSDKILKVNATRLRHELAASPITIYNTYGIGYRLDYRGGL